MGRTRALETAAQAERQASKVIICTKCFFFTSKFCHCCSSWCAKVLLCYNCLCVNRFLLQVLPSVLWHCWLGGRQGIRPVKNGGGGGGQWLVWIEWCPAGWSVCLSLLIFPCTIKSRNCLLAVAHPGGPGKRAKKRLWWWCEQVLEYATCLHCYHKLQSTM